MSNRNDPILSVVIPLYNEAPNLPRVYELLKPVLADLKLRYEIVFVNDGSTDDSLRVLGKIAKVDSSVRIVSLTRNFGKEIAVTAGINKARGQAILTLDADGQHPVDRLPLFIEKWQQGARVVVGKRTGRKANLLKRVGSKLFNGVFRQLTGVRLDAETSDFRLIDRSVQAEFNKLTEHNRIARGLIDWLGHQREYVPYLENPRLHGKATYSFKKLFKLAIDSAISLSISPLYITAYIGAVVLPLATLLGLGMVVNFIFGDPIHAHATGGAYLMVLILFLIGILLVSQGIIGLYLSHIHSETQNRPLYVVDEEHSKDMA